MIAGGMIQVTVEVNKYDDEFWTAMVDVEDLADRDRNRTGELNAYQSVNERSRNKAHAVAFALQELAKRILKDEAPVAATTKATETAKSNPFRIACAACGDTGVIETGNNDLPCTCAAGNKAMFNVATAAGLKQISGEELKGEANSAPALRVKYMQMREIADSLWERGKKTDSSALHSEAAELLKRILELEARG